MVAYPGDLTVFIGICSHGTRSLCYMRSSIYISKLNISTQSVPHAQSCSRSGSEVMNSDSEGVTQWQVCMSQAPRVPTAALRLIHEAVRKSHVSRRHLSARAAFYSRQTVVPPSIDGRATAVSRFLENRFTLHGFRIVVNYAVVGYFICYPVIWSRERKRHPRSHVTCYRVATFSIVTCNKRLQKTAEVMRRYPSS
jgi:hypothetical protein